MQLIIFLLVGEILKSSCFMRGHGPINYDTCAILKCINSCLAARAGSFALPKQVLFSSFELPIHQKKNDLTNLILIN